MNNKAILTAGCLTLLFSVPVWAQTTSADVPAVAKTQQQSEAISRKQNDLVVKKHADGSESVDLKGRFQMYSVVKVVNGELVYSCQNHDHLDPNHSHTTDEQRGVK